MTTIWPWLVYVIGPITGGGLVYILFRSRTLVMFDWWDSLRLTGVIGEFRAWAEPAREMIPEFLLYSAPDGAWLYAYLMFYRLIWQGESTRALWTWSSLGIGASIGLEIGQGLGFFEGTFDWMDLGTYALAILLALKTNLPIDVPVPQSTDLRGH